MKIDDKFKEVKDFQQFRAKAKAGAGAGAGTGAGAVAFKCRGLEPESEPLENVAAPQHWCLHTKAVWTETDKS